MTTFQQLIREAEQSSEPEAPRSMDLRIEIKTHGKPSHLWKIALRICRHVHVIFGDGVIFMTLGNDEIVDSLEDDDGEYWHSLDEWKEGANTLPIDKREEEARAILRRGVWENLEVDIRP